MPLVSPSVCQCFSDLGLQVGVRKRELVVLGQAPAAFDLSFANYQQKMIFLEDNNVSQSWISLAIGCDVTGCRLLVAHRENQSASHSCSSLCP